MNAYVPHKSQSHDLNDFYRTTAEHIARLSRELEATRADMRLLVSMLKVQNVASSRTIEQLTDEALRPVCGEDGTIEQTLSASAFTPVSGAVSVGRAIIPRFAKEESRILVSLSDGTQVIPSDTVVEVSPPLTKTMSETNPRGAIEGDMPWWRQIPISMLDAEAEYTINLSQVHSRSYSNEIRFTTFPSAGVKIEDILVRQKGSWKPVPGVISSDSGDVVCLFEPTVIEAVKIKLARTTPLFLNNTSNYHLGLAGVNILQSTPSEEKIQLDAAVELLGAGPYTIEEISVDCWPTTYWSLSIYDGESRYTPADLPFIIYSDTVNIRIETVAPGLLAMFKGATIKYKASLSE